MKKLHLHAFVLALIFSSCHKNRQSPSIVGSWTLTGFAGRNSTQSSPSAKTITTNYSFNAPVLTETDTTSTVMVTVNNEIWTFNSDGTFSINENYQPGNATSATSHLMSGWWDYTSSTIPNSTIILRGAGSPTIAPVGGSFFIKSISTTQLVLYVAGSSSSSTGSASTVNFTLTFTRG